MRDHEPITFEKFKGLWARGDQDSCPLDHFSDCNNVDYEEDSVITRGPFDNLFAGPGIVLRSYVYQTVVAGAPRTFILVLRDNFHLYSIEVGVGTTDLMTFTSDGNALDFAFVNINGRAYISPSNKITGLGGTATPARDIVFVFDGTSIAPAAGHPPTTGGPMVAANSATVGNVQAGLHYYAVVGETATGFITPYFEPSLGTNLPAPIGLTSTGGFKVDLSSILRNNAAFTPALVKRHIIATRTVPVGFAGLAADLPFYFVPGGTLNDDTTTTLTINFYDSELIDDATYLANLAVTIPAGVALFTYHNRMAVLATKDNPSNAYFSLPGDPESIDQVNGVLPVDIPHSSFQYALGPTAVITGLTAGQEYRDICYLWKFNRTYAINDTGQEPAQWPIIVLDEGIGALVHGIITVLDSGGINIDYILVADKTGIYTFDGYYRKPEATWKIASLWTTLVKNYDTSAPLIGMNHFVNDTYNKKIYISCSFNSSGTGPDEILMIDYTNVSSLEESSYMNLKFSRWRKSATTQFSSILLYDFGGSGGTPSVLLLGANIVVDAGSNRFMFKSSDLTISTGEVMSAPYFQTGFMEDGQGNVLHFAGIRSRVQGQLNGAGTNTLTPTLIGADFTTTVTLPNIIVAAGASATDRPWYFPTTLANFVNQKAMLKITGESKVKTYFQFSKIVVFVKEMFASLPV